MKYDFCFIDNGALSEKDLWNNEIHLIESGIDNGALSEKDLWNNEIHLIESGIVANNSINYLNNFLRLVI